MLSLYSKMFKIYISLQYILCPPLFKKQIQQAELAFKLETQNRALNMYTKFHSLMAECLRSKDDRMPDLVNNSWKLVP